MAKKAKKQETPPAPIVTKKPYLPDLDVIYPVSSIALERFVLTEYLERVTADRAYALLRGVNIRPGAQLILEGYGFSEEERRKGWELLAIANGTYVVVSIPKSSEEQRKAEAEIDQWDEPHFAIIKAGLKPFFPQQVDYLFHQLEPSSGPEAVVGVKKLLRRVEILEQGLDPQREDTREEDKAAIQELHESRLLTKETRQHLNKLIKLVETLPEEAIKKTELAKQQKDFQREALKRLALWCEKWRTIGKRMIKKRNYLISLGLAEKRMSKSKTPAKDATNTSNTPEVVEDVVTDTDKNSE